MGDTLDALKTAQLFAFDMVVAIEGYPNLITSGSTAAAITAWAATPFVAAIDGLQCDGATEQRFDPWEEWCQVGSLSFRITGPSSETFAQDAMRRASSAPQNDTEMTAVLDNLELAIPVVDESAFTNGNEGFIGCERFSIDANPAGFVECLYRGLYAPFNSDGSSTHRFGRYHHMASAGINVHLRPQVTQQCLSFQGKRVGVWLHRRKSSGVLDTKAEAQLIFAGRIKNLSETANGETVVDCEDVRGEIRDRVLLADQFRGDVKHGIKLLAGAGGSMKFEARDQEYDGLSPELNATDLVVVSGTPTAPYEIAEGYYTVDELLSAMNAWLQAALEAGDLYGAHAWDLPSVGGERRVRLSSKFSGAAGTTNCRAVITMRSHVAEFLGIDAAVFNTEVVNEGIGAEQLEAIGSFRPYKVYVQTYDADDSFRLETQDTTGTWIGQTDYLPQSLAGFVTQVGDWGILQITGGYWLFGRHVGSGAFTMKAIPGLGTAIEHNQILGIPYDDPGELEVHQVVMLEGRFKNLVRRIFASTGTVAFNHADYDVFDYQLGVGIPWEILGTPFSVTLGSIDDGSGGSMCITIDKPTKLTEILGCEFTARLASLQWKNQTLQVAAWQTATSSLALHILTEDNKASALKGDTQKTVLSNSDDLLKNIVKFEYARSLDGGYEGGPITITDVPSITRYGDKVYTISMRNSVGGDIAIGQDVKTLAESMAVRLPLLSRPLNIVRRTISQHFFEDVAPGDICTIDDEFCRPPTGGARGLNGQPGIIIEHRRRFPLNGSPQFGEVIVALNMEDRNGTYCPCAEVDSTYTSGSFTNGYSAGTVGLHFQANRHSYSSDTITTDVAHFAVNDEVVIIEIDPSNPAAPRSWDRTIATVSTNEVTLTGGALTGYTSAERYRMISQYYTDAVATQAVDTYQADAADLLIQDVSAAYLYGIYSTPTLTIASDPTTDLPARHATVAFADGAPLDTGFEMDLIHAANNFNHVAAALVAPQIHDEWCTVGVAAGWYLVDEIPLFVGVQKLISMQRLLTVAPFARLNAPGSADIRVRLARSRSNGDANLNVGLVAPYSEATFTVSSTTAATLATQTLSIAPIADGATGRLWLIVEAEATVEYKGISYIQLGAGTGT